ncbi:FliI/YscN family ATPase [Pararobbsia silviterrae]|uniref:FliI/YscN family ATPase n=1 Tax=Pararobbsia silviterrae TaxID=1792498 RepID=UPI001981628B|nr:FliI/YscN family ATPase [Pararobbsia silviterrae]
MSAGAQAGAGWPRSIVRAAPIRRLNGSVLEASLPDVRIGELCLIREAVGRSTIVGRAQVIGFSESVAVLALLGPAHGLSRHAVVEPTGGPLKIAVSMRLLGCAIDADGGIHETLTSPHADGERAIPRGASAQGACFDEVREVDAPRVRAPCAVTQPLETGVRVIDGVLGVGVGQRVAVLAQAGAGKTTLLHMIAAQSRADVVVIGLIGERGREVAETIERLREVDAGRRCVVVRATSDAPAVERAAAAASAMTIAEYFRDCGLHVLLVFDSLTRYARALREIALAAGELPARHGFPASVFERLPRLLERAGNTGEGAITAFFSVLVDHEDELDPIAHEVISILDGHVVLSSAMAREGLFPAIDVLRSVSRVAARVGSSDDVQRAYSVRRVFARAAQLATLVEMGEYRAGMIEDDDRALDVAQRLRHVFAQGAGHDASIAETRRLIDEALV